MSRQPLLFPDLPLAVWTAWFDGSAGPTNPGHTAIGAVLYKNAELKRAISEHTGWQSNNFSEYKALIAVLEAAVELGAESLIVYGDSLLVINTVSGRWRCKSSNLRPLHEQAIALAKKIPDISFKWIPREKNTEADALSRGPYPKY